MGAFKAVRTRVHDRSLELYDHLQLIAELCRLRVNYRPGSAEVVNPRTGVSHGDMAVAIALAVHEIDAYDRHLGEREALSVGSKGSSEPT
jgi:hypothetical protein